MIATLSRDVTDKKAYEIINDNSGDYAIVAEYEDKYIVMNCRIDNDTNSLLLEKGAFRFMDYTEPKRVFQKVFQNVACE